MSWPELSPAVRDLFRRGAELALTPEPGWVEEMHAAALSGPLMRAVAEDPVLAEETKRTNLANLVHWAAANVQHPGRRVAPNLGPDVLDTARDLVRRGLDGTALDSYRTGQNTAWRRWLDICFGLTSDVDDLRALLDASALSISTFIDDSIAAVTGLIEAERAELTEGTQAERRATVELLLEGAPIPRARAEARLGHVLTGPHTAAVVWGPPGTPSSALEVAAEALVRVSGAARRLTVVASASTLWVWLPVDAAPSREALLPLPPDVRIALGRPGTDLAGFRRSHLDAAVTQRMVARLGTPSQVAGYDEVQLVALLSTDPAAADEFVADTLGALVDPDLREVVLTYLQEQSNASATAQRLFTHRNTVLRRLERADALLPRPLAENAVHVGAALLLLHWRGTP